jgi:hypothetical protein
MVVLPLSIFIIFVLLYTTFGNFRHSLLILAILPFALSGGIFALLIRGLHISVSASIGFIALFGVAVLNGVVLVTFNYSSCPQLCDLQLGNLVEALATVRLVPGKQFRLATIILAPGEPPARAARTRRHHVEKLRQLGGDLVEGAAGAGAVDGWTFLVSADGKDERAIRAVAAAVGFGYRYDQRQDEYAHPATIIALSAKGVITRYVHGIEPVGTDLEQTIVSAGLADPTASSGFVMSCFHWDPDGRAAWGRRLMRYGAFSFASVLLAVVAVVLWRRRPRHPSGVTPS